MKTNIATILLFIICIACKKDDGPPPNPSAANLIFPEDNSECNEGTILSNTQSDVTFRWDASNATNSYTLNLTNLTTNTSTTQQSAVNELKVTLERATPYSWFVTSNGAENTSPANSDTWRFYNAGLAAVSHPPFPATVLTPAMGSVVFSGAIVLRWSSSDVDNDIENYQVLFDTVSPPIQSAGTTSNKTQTVTTNPSTVYYWQIITTDRAGNKTTSPVFEFRTN